MAIKQRLDSPTNNFAVLNILSEQGAALNNGNLRISDSSSTGFLFRPTSLAFPNIGKWYAEFYYEAVNNNNDIYIKVHHDGLSWSDSRPLSIRSNSGSAIIYDESLTSSNSATGTVANGAVVGILVDFDNNKVIFNEGGQYSGEVSITSNDGYNYYYGIGFDNQTGTKIVIANFGQDSTFNAGTSIGSVADKNGFGLFQHTPVNNNSTQITDFKALCTANLPEMTPTVDDDVPKDYFKAVIWDGNGTSQNITEVGFQSDLVWWKGRGPTQYYHNVTDSIRGVTKQLFTNAAGAEETNTTRITGWLSNGFSIGNKNDINTSGEKYVAWCWKAGGNNNTFNINGTGYSTYSALQTANTSLPASSTSGMIVPSGMSINTDAGFSIVKYQGVGTTTPSTIPHGLNQSLDFYIVKSLSSRSWELWFNGFTASEYMILNSTTQKQSYSDAWGSVPTDSTFGVNNSNNSNYLNENYIAYCWHSVEGYSKFGSYTGNGSTDGPMVYCGFRPAFVMIKQITTTSDYTSWAIFDNARDPSNPTNYLHSIYANRSAQEGKRGDGTSANSANVVVLDILSNGFKLRDVGGGEVNQDTKEYIFMAFAEQSFNYANAR